MHCIINYRVCTVYLCNSVIVGVQTLFWAVMNNLDWKQGIGSTHRRLNRLNERSPFADIGG